MSPEVPLRKMFAGANSGYGFFSLFYHIAGPRAEKVFLIKGGPGTGKSTLMKNFGEKMLARGEDVELFFCSSDNDSLDAVYLPTIKAAIIDATAPHVMDPIHPGAVEEIVNLGDCWQEKGLKQHRERIISINKAKKLLFNNAYVHLSSCLSYLTGIRQYYKDSCSMDEKGLALLASSIAGDMETLMQGEKIKPHHYPLERHLFASALTPAGTVHHLGNLIKKLDYVYSLEGEAGTGKRTLLARVFQTASLLGLDIEVFHCGLDPKRIEHLILPQLKLGIFTSESPHQLANSKVKKIVCTDDYCAELPSYLCRLLGEMKGLYAKSLELACEKLNQAKGVHKELEEIYSREMNYDLVDKKASYIYDKIDCLLAQH